MLPIIKILAVFALIILLLRKRYNTGLVMLTGAAVLGLAFEMAPTALARQLGYTLISPTTVALMGILVLIMMLESVMRKTGMLENMTGSLLHLPLNRSLIFASIPAIIGLLPSAGGARFSAPLVDRATAGASYRAEDRVFINYWFRHVWEFSLPLYPGLILAAHFSGIPMGTIILWQWPFTVAWAVLGYRYLLNFRRRGGQAAANETTGGVGGGQQQDTGVALGQKAGPNAATNNNGGGNWLRTLVKSTWPLWITVLLVLAHVPMLWALGGVLALLAAQTRYPLRQVWYNLREPMVISIIIMIWGIMAFRDVLEVTGAVAQISQSVMQFGVPLVLMTILLPLVTGVLTGLVTACIGISFPLILSFAEPTVANVMLAYVAGVIGVMLSPVHLCLILTVEYFKADFIRSYRFMVAPSLLVMAGAAGLFWLAG